MPIQSEDPTEWLRDVDGLRKVANGALAQLTTAVFTLFSVTVYVSIAALATSHRDLLIGRSFRLPIFDVEVGLLQFYFLAPAVLVGLLVLALQACASAASRLVELRERLPAKDWQRTAQTLSSFPWLDGLSDKPHCLKTQIPLFCAVVLFPGLALLQLQWTVLPAQLPWLVLWQSVWVVGATVALWQLGPSFFRTGAGVGTIRAGGLALAVASIIMLVDQAPQLSILNRLQLDGTVVAENDRAVYETNIDPDTLDVRLAVIDPDRTDKTPKDFASLKREHTTVSNPSLHGKSLRHASLVGTMLVGVDLTDADLRGADLRYADLRHARLENADLTMANLTEARLEGADLTKAILSGVTARYARLDGAFLHDTKFIGADLHGAHLRLVQFRDPAPFPNDAGDVPAAATDDPGLVPPSFRDAILHGAQLWGTPLEQDRWKADIGGNKTSRIDLRGADLQHAVLYDFDLSKADLDGADLSNAALLPPSLNQPNSKQYGTVRDFNAQRAYKIDGKTHATACLDFEFPDLRYSAVTLLTEQTWDHLRVVLGSLTKLKLECQQALADGAARPTELAEAPFNPVPAAEPRSCSDFANLPAEARSVLEYLCLLASAQPSADNMVEGWCHDAGSADPFHGQAFLARARAYACIEGVSTGRYKEQFEQLVGAVRTNCRISAPFKPPTCDR